MTKVSTPRPILYNLKEMENPFRQKSFDAGAFFHNKNPGFDQDYEFALKFIYSYRGSPATFNAYRREVERLLQWCWFIESLSIFELKRAHIEAFIEFCLDPPPEWIGTANLNRFVIKNGSLTANVRWRPFVVNVPKAQRKNGTLPDIKNYVMSQSAIKAIFAILSSFFDFLIQEELIESNPVALIRQKSQFIQKSQHAPYVRRLTNLQWEYLIETAELMAGEAPYEHERTLFLMNCLFAMYLRISELAASERHLPRMSDFKRDRDGNWWFYVTGKGNKSRKITVSNEMLEALKRYRAFRGLSPLPSGNDTAPLIPKQRGKGPLTSSRHLREIIQNCFDQAYARMKNDGLEEDAIDLKAATVHWLRHTGISEDVKTRPREHVRDDAGHASMQTTDRYIETDDRERHQSGRSKLIKEL